VVEAAIRPHGFVEGILASVTEGRVTEVVAQRQRFRQIVIEAERAGERPGNLANLHRMGKPCAVMVALVRDKNLRLMGETAEGRRMQDTVPVTLEFASRRRAGLWKKAPPAVAGV
jgi:hypothetical protein